MKRLATTRARPLTGPRPLLLLLLLLLALPALTAQVGCSESADPAGDVDASLSIRISSPSDATRFVTGCPTITLGGTASINSGWFRCCPAEDGSTMSARNETTGVNVPVFSRVEYFIFATRVWELTAPLVEGSNRIRISLRDQSGNVASETVFVTRPATAACSP